MRYYKSSNGGIFAFSDIQTVPDDLIPLTPEEINALLSPPSMVPQVVSAAQGGIALIRAGLMDAVQAAVDAPETPSEVKWAWAHATTWDRSSPALAFLAGAAGITQEQMDALFMAADKIVA